jgi:glucan phosphoethanolaminetransferase (alkaline phosphatase superfamily)
MSSFFQKIFNPKNEINYLYFSFFLLFLSLLSASHYLCWEQPHYGIALFFLLYALGQAFLEVCCFILIAYSLKRWAPRWAFLCFIGISFLLMLLHYTHFTMVRLMDASLGYIFKFLFGSGIVHLIVGFQALNMNGTMIALVVGTFLLIPIAGLGFYWLTSHLIRKRPLQLSLFQIALALASVGTSLFLLDLFAPPFLTRHIHHKYRKTLPLGMTFLSPMPNTFLLPAPLTPFRDEKQIDIPKIAAAHLPNIYFFVIETLRKDYVNASTAPHLSAFGADHIQFPHSFSNASSTQSSWFAIFHADVPLHWARMRDAWEKGSVPLRFLKHLGYKIHIYSSADLRYFNMDKLLFGSKRELGDIIEEYTFNRTLEPCERDMLAIETLKKNLAREGHLYLIFLDATHSEYSFPKDFPLKFEPIAKEIDYLTISPKSPELEHIKNRYRNAIHYVDSLMGGFFTALKTEKLWDDAIIAITGDHGEEFFEEGALFHGTHINSYQTSVPIFLKFPSKDWIPQTQEATHMDLFPSILHYLTKQSDFSSLFDGQSVFSLNRWPYRIAVLQNGPDTPTEFSIQRSDLKLHARVIDPTQIEILELQGMLKPDIFVPLIKKI